MLSEWSACKQNPRRPAGGHSLASSRTPTLPLDLLQAAQSYTPFPPTPALLSPPKAVTCTSSQLSASLGCCQRCILYVLHRVLHLPGDLLGAGQAAAVVNSKVHLQDLVEGAICSAKQTQGKAQFKTWDSAECQERDKLPHSSLSTQRRLAKFNRSQAVSIEPDSQAAHRRPTPPRGQTIRLQGPVLPWMSSSESTASLGTARARSSPTPRLRTPRSKHHTRDVALHLHLGPPLLQSWGTAWILAVSTSTHLCGCGPVVQTLRFRIWGEHWCLRGFVKASWDQGWERTP